MDVVVTHWPPTRRATASRFRGNEVNGHFVSDLEDLIEEIGVQYWISGHVHDAYEAVVGDTRVIGNPTGCPREAVERSLFRPDRVIEVSPCSRIRLYDRNPIAQRLAQLPPALC